MKPSLRILDLGVSDGAFPAWLHWQLKDDEVDLTVDGLDLDQAHVEKARARARELGLAGEFVCGNALDAPEYFPPGGYDAVYCFEIIEHVPDPVALLDVCERMLKPGGRVYISTPDGTFGSGGNPHHLHAFRAIDLADALRRRGSLCDMAVGSDGVTVASYTPRPRLDDIAIYTGPGWEPWHPSDPEQRGLGGSETATIRLAEALSALGFVVTVYGDVREDACWTDVLYRHHSKFDPLDSRGALISSRMPEIFDRPVAAPVRMLWLHDVDCGPRLTQRRANAIDKVLVLSDWHLRHVAEAYPFLAEQGKLLQTRNGIRHRHFHPQPWEQRAQRVLYTSSPDRGLDILLEIWPQVLEQAPDAELWHCYAEVYDRVADQEPIVAAHRARIRELSDQPGVKRLPSQPQPALAALMCQSRVWAHPSWNTPSGAPFHETSCIGAMEAQAAGCHVVASDWGALCETVRYGRLVNSDPPGERWRAGLVAHIVEGLTNPDTGAAAVGHAPAAVADLHWQGVAEQIAVLVAADDRARATI